MSVSPQGNSDNVFVQVHPGTQFDYAVRIPSHGRQGPGLFWYHPHAHGFVTKQILGGMSGGLVVEGSDRLYPILSGLPERFFLIKHAELGEGNEIISINGQLNPLIDIRPGEMQFWRIAHIGATLFIRFRIGGMPLYVVATLRAHSKSTTAIDVKLLLTACVVPAAGGYGYDDEKSSDFRRCPSARATRRATRSS